MTRERTYMLCVGLCLVGMHSATTAGGRSTPHTPAVASPSVEQAATLPSSRRRRFTLATIHPLPTHRTLSRKPAVRPGKRSTFTPTSFCVPQASRQARCGAERNVRRRMEMG